MSDRFSRVKVINGVARRRRFTAEQKLAVVTETMQPGTDSGAAGDRADQDAAGDAAPAALRPVL